MTPNTITIPMPQVFDLQATEALRRKCQRGKQFIIDFTETEYVDNSAISVLHMFLTMCGEGRTLVAGCNTQLRDIFSLAIDDVKFL